MNWLVSQGLTGTPENDLLRGFCERCCAAGLPLSRGLVFIDTLHPIFEGRGFRWNDTETNESDTFEYGSTSEGSAAQNWRRSTFYHMLENGHEELSIDLAECAKFDFSMIDELAAKGHKHFVAFVHRFGEAGTIGQMDCFYSYWVTRRDGRLWRAGAGRAARSGAGARAGGQVRGAGRYRAHARPRLSRPRRLRTGAARPHRARRHRAHQRGACGFPTCAARPRSARASGPTRSFRSSMIMRRPRSTPSTTPAARC